MIRKFLKYISDKIDLKWIDNLRAGASYEYLKCLKFHSDEGLWSCPSARYIDSALEKMDMVGCNGSNSPKVSKSEEPGDMIRRLWTTSWQEPSDPLCSRCCT